MGDIVGTSSNRLVQSAILGICVTLSGPTLAQKLYKWVDADGNVFYSDQVPPEHKDHARERLNDQGVVVDQVDRAKTPEELAEEARLAKLETERLKAEEQQRQKDRVVLNSYTSEQDIIRQRNSQIASIDRLIDMTRAAMKSEQLSLNHLVARAADLERKGRPVTDALKSQIENMRRRITDQEALIAKREAEKATVEENFQSELSRYREVVGRRES